MSPIGAAFTAALLHFVWQGAVPALALWTTLLPEFTVFRIGEGLAELRIKSEP